MWIELSKILPYLLFPVSLLLECVLVAWLFGRFGKRKLAAMFALFGFTQFLLAASPMVASHLIQSLEQRFEGRQAQAMPEADAIVVLGGALGLPLSPRPGVMLTESSDRVLYAARLYRANKSREVIISGGNVFTQRESVQPEAFYIKQLLIEWGVDEAVISLEGDSRNTRENAVETKKLLEQKGIETILLVTSAFHMARALATFQNVGIKAIPAPTDFRVANYSQPLLLDILPSADALRGTTFALREYLGIVVYAYREWLDADKIFTHE